MAPPAADELETILITAQRAERTSTGATGLSLDIKDTPQSISVVSSEQMHRFGADSVNDALRLATGVRVDEWETNRTSYSARGFDILNTQIDGVGMPNSWGIATGATDSFGYDKVEVIRGANGLLTGVGNAAGTINYVRKRPTNNTQGTAGITYGSWNTLRAEADYSTPFTQDGRWAGRIVVAHEDGESYLDVLENKRDFAYGVIDGQIGANGTLTVGYSYQKADTDGNMWGALPWNYSDGTQAEWPIRTSTTQDWTFWNTTNQAAFAEYTHQLSAGWQVTASYNHRRHSSNERMFYAWDGMETGLDPATGAGLSGYPWAGRDKMTTNLGAVSLNGHFDLFGRDQEAMLGVSTASSRTKNWDENALDYSWEPLPAFPYATNAIPEPTWDAPSLATDLDQRLTRVFGAARIALTDRLKAIVGVNYVEYHREGTTYGLYSDQTTRNTSPYGGLTFDFSERILGYVSYSDIYQPQDQVDENDEYLDASKGANYEIGIKADWLDGRLLTTLAVFRAEQDGLATPTGRYNEFGSAIYAPVDVRSKGVEVEAVGKVAPNVDLVFGYTALKLDGDNGGDTYPWVPRRTANLLLSASLPSYTAVSFGLGGRWQSGIFNTESNGFDVRQGSYAVINAFAAWNPMPNLTVRANIDNLAGEKYINTLRYSGYYGAPRNFSVGAHYRF